MAWYKSLRWDMSVYKSKKEFKEKEEFSSFYENKGYKLSNIRTTWVKKLIQSEGYCIDGGGEEEYGIYDSFIYHQDCEVESHQIGCKESWIADVDNWHELVNNGTIQII